MVDRLRPAWLALAVGAASMASGCGGAVDDDVPVDAAPGMADASATIDATPPADAPTAALCTPASGAKLRLVEVASGLAEPVFATAPPGDPRLFLVEQPGRVRVLAPGGELLATPFLDITEAVRDTSNEQGLLGLAFHPNYSSTGRFFVHYTGASGETVIAEYAVSDTDPDVAAPGETVVLTTAQPEANHNGGSIAFGPDGMLYIALGDGGGAGDAHGIIGNGQSLDTLLGKILRLDVDSASPYAVPASNPFVGADGLDEIWAYGLRNPWRMSFDRDTGDLYIGDVGQNAFEEIDVQPAASAGGENYGWRILEGDACYGETSCSEPADYVAPIATYAHTNAPCDSVTGGYVYRGACMTDWYGVYFYADYCRAQVWAFELADGAATNQRELTSELDPDGLLAGGVSSFGEDGFGELYVTVFSGRVYRIEVE